MERLQTDTFGGVVACPLYPGEPPEDPEPQYDRGTGDTGEYAGGEAMYDSAAEVLSSGGGGT